MRKRLVTLRVATSAAGGLKKEIWLPISSVMRTSEAGSEDSELFKTRQAVVASHLPSLASVRVIEAIAPSNTSFSGT